LGRPTITGRTEKKGLRHLRSTSRESEHEGDFRSSDLANCRSDANEATDSLPTLGGTVQTRGGIWSQNFVFLWPAIAAGATSIGALFGLSENNQLLLFSLLSMLLLTLSRTLLKKALFPEHNRLRSNADALPGRLVEVIERVGNQENPGTVQLGGEVWSAYSHDGRWMDPGHQARVIKVDGLKLVVEPKAP
jgi:membrane protein implicated in regulation of membrane protease activity